MLDTVVLVLQAPSFTISNPNAFSPHIQTYPQFTSRGYVSCVQNPTAQDRQENVYKPCLTHTMRIVRGAIKTTLAIQCSIPKLLYLNNLDEVTDDALEQVIQILRAKLLDMGVGVHPTSLRLAPVSVIHYSKNIILPPGLTPSMIMSQLAKLDIPLTFSIDHTRFKNAGHGINMYSKSFEVVFYDKIKDLQKGLKTPFDSDPTAYQQSLFDPQERAREAGILRLEVRIKKKPKLERLLETCGQSRSLYFGSLFSTAVSQAILLHVWQQLMSPKNLAILNWNDSIDLERIAEQTSLTPQRLLSSYGAILCAQKYGMRKLRAIMERKGSTRTWYRIKADVELVSAAAKISQPSWVQHVFNVLHHFQPYRVKGHHEQKSTQTHQSGHPRSSEYQASAR